MRPTSLPTPDMIIDGAERHASRPQSRQSASSAGTGCAPLWTACVRGIVGRDVSYIDYTELLSLYNRMQYRDYKLNFSLSFDVKISSPISNL